MKTAKIYRLILIAILVFSGWAYFYQLGKESLVTDEYLSLYVAQQSPTDILLGHKKDTNPNTIPPLYELFLHYWMKIFGAGEFAQRSLSAILGVLSVYLLFLLSSMLFDIKTGLVSALFGSFSFTWFLLFRQNRCYGLFVFLALLSFYTFFYFMKNAKNKNAIFYLTAINIFLIYTHYLAFFVILLQVIFSLAERRRDKRILAPVIAMCLAVVLAYLPWFSNFFYDFFREPIIVRRSFPSSMDKVVFDIFRILFSDFHFLWNPVLVILYVPFIIRGVVKLKNNYLKKGQFFPIYLTLIFIIPFIFVYFFMSADRYRYYAPFMFPMFIILAYGMQGLNTKGMRNKFFLLFVFVFAASNNIMDFADFFSYSMNEEWKQAVQLIKRTPNFHGKENIFIFQTRYNPPVFSYYYWGPEVAARLVDNIANKTNYEKETLGIGNKNKIFVIGRMKGQAFFELLDSFPEGVWIWIFRYHDLVFFKEFIIENDDRYFFHQISLNKELPSIDFFLLKRMRK